MPTVDPSHVASPAPGPAASPSASAAYRVRLARSRADLQAAQALRFAVFNLELREGLAGSYATGLDADPFDAVCDHLLVESVADGAVVGTYRLQSGVMAAQALGYYSAGEFDFSPFEAQRAHLLELGRACIHRQHRHFAVLNLLWRGIAAYARERGLLYLIGCSSLQGQDMDAARAAWQFLRQHHLAPADWRTVPHASHDCVGDGAAVATTPLRIPRLLTAYMALGACVCGPPALDAEFGSIDFLTWLDLESPRLHSFWQRGRFVG